MSNLLRRFELLLPLRFNDGQPVSEDLIVDTLLELEQRFGAVSAESQTTRGLWRHEGKAYRDELVRVYVDVADTLENRTFFADLKQRLKARFQQLDIRLTTFLVEEM